MHGYVDMCFINDIGKIDMKLEYVVKTIIQNYKIKTQSELTELLYRKGIDTTQSNISRILKKLNTIKVTDDNKQSYYVIQSKPLDVNCRVKSLVNCIDPNVNGIIIRTYSSAAPLVGQIIGERKIDGILSTLCSNNTVFVVVEDANLIDEIINNLRLLFLGIDEK